MNSTVLEGWQFNDSSRSSWDLVWTCLTTIFACTWTVLHQPVAGRNKSEATIVASKLTVWIFTFLAPEMLVLEASQQFWQVWSLTTRCNAAQANSDNTTGELDSWLYNRTQPLADAYNGEDLELYPLPARWIIPQCWCVQMGGLTLETQDGWTFCVGPEQIVQWIEAGVVRCTDFSEREIKDRARADTFAKAFTVCQSTWVTVNIVARAGYKLPITPIEVATLAYVACAIMTYACWWHKPQDMAVQIAIPLRYTREGLPQEIRSLADAYPRRWQHRRVIPKRERTGAAFLSVGKRLQDVAVDQPVRGALTRAYRGLSLRDESWLNTFAGLSGMLFCGLHVAAWNFPFPTHAEQMAWRVCSLSTLGSVVVVYVLGQAPLLARWCSNRGVSLPSYMHEFADPQGRYTRTEVYGQLLCIGIYVLTRLGLVALTLSSLRALPSGAYIAVDWLGSIPHI
ncbi:hypothetical protein BDW62DRAFT_194079 [Aspergillus aurantiobrunneus]